MRSREVIERILSNERKSSIIFKCHSSLEIIETAKKQNRTPVMLDTCVIYDYCSGRNKSNSFVEHYFNDDYLMLISNIVLFELIMTEQRFLKTNPKSDWKGVSFAIDNLISFGAQPIFFDYNHAQIMQNMPIMQLPNGELHKDLFDRAIIAQAIALGVPLISKDQAFKGYSKLQLIDVG